MLDQWRLFCEKPPKGFEKFFEKNKAPKAAAEKEGGKEVKKGGKEEQRSEPPPTRPSSTASGGPSSKQQYDSWSFKLFGGTGSRLVASSVFWANKYIFVVLKRIIL